MSFFLAFIIPNAVEAIWRLLCSIFKFYNPSYADTLDKEQLLAVVNAALDTIPLLKNANIDGNSTLRYLFCTLKYVMRSGKFDENKVIERDTINKCLQALKSPKGNWNYERRIWDAAFEFFRECEDKHNGILSNNAHLNSSFRFVLSASSDTLVILPIFSSCSAKQPMPPTGPLQRKLPILYPNWVQFWFPQTMISHST